MSVMFEELDYRETPIGPLSLRRRRDPGSGEDYHEIKLGDAFLMSSRFTVSEIALAQLGLDAHGGENLDVVVGGLGLGYTAQAALAHPALGALVVVELLEAVIDWHRSALLPLGRILTGDVRCRITQGDFFGLAGADNGFDPAVARRRFDLVLVDIDHSPDLLLDERSRPFYSIDGLRAVSRHLRSGGIFGLWSNDGPDASFTERLSRAFDEAWAVPVSFYNPLQNREAVQTVYLARCGVAGA